MASRLYLRGHTTRIEYRGGLIKPLEGEGDARTVSSDCDEVSEPNEGVIKLPGTPGLKSLGSLIPTGASAKAGSGTYEEADERSDRRLVDCARDRSEGSELAEEAAGDSRPKSRLMEWDGDGADSEEIEGDSFASPSEADGIVLVFFGPGVGVALDTTPVG